MGKYNRRRTLTERKSNRRDESMNEIRGKWLKWTERSEPNASAQGIEEEEEEEEED